MLVRMYCIAAMENKKMGYISIKPYHEMLYYRLLKLSTGYLCYGLANIHTLFRCGWCIRTCLRHEILTKLSWIRILELLNNKETNYENHQILTSLFTNNLIYSFRLSMFILEYLHKEHTITIIQTQLPLYSNKCLEIHQRGKKTNQFELQPFLLLSFNKFHKLNKIIHIRVIADVALWDIVENICHKNSS